MSARPENDLLPYYLRYDLSPANPAEPDLDRLSRARAGLYRQLGILPGAFRGSRILEIGPGGGLNALVLSGWGPAELALVEPNPRAVAEIRRVFEGRGLMPVVFPGKIEDYPAQAGAFDFVLCEGLLPGLSNRDEILEIITACLKPGGVLVATCVDEIGFFSESLRRLVGGVYLHRNRITEFDGMVSALVALFRPHLATLPGVTRRTEDWVCDQLLNPVYRNGLFSLEDIIRRLSPDFDFYRSSPSFCRDYRWYKSLPDQAASSWNREVIEQFRRNRHNLLDCRYVFPERTEEENRVLFDACRKVYWQVEAFLASSEESQPQELARLVQDSLPLAQKVICSLSPVLAVPLEEVMVLLTKGNFSIAEFLDGCPELKQTWGRAQQYVSLIKRDAAGME